MYSEIEIEIISSIFEKVSNQVSNKNWDRIESNFWWTPGMVSSSNYGYYNGQRTSLNEVRLTGMNDQIDGLQREGELSNRIKWNQVTLTFFPNGTFNAKYAWDEEWNQDVLTAQAEAAAEIEAEKKARGRDGDLPQTEM